MRSMFRVGVLFLAGSLSAHAADTTEFQERRQRAAALFHDGILLVHARSVLELSGDGFRQDPVFYYFTGLESTASALLAIDGRSGQSSLFLSLPARSSALAESMDPLSVKSLPPEVSPGTEAAARLGIDHVEEWSALESFLAKNARSLSTLYYAPQRFSLEELPPSLLAAQGPSPPLWAVTIAKKWPTLHLEDGGARIFALMAVQSPAEMESVRRAANATVRAILAGMKAIKPGATQRVAEVAVENACWQNARGVSSWPWVMAGEKGIFPHPWASLLRYDHLNGVMQAGDLVRLDVGCEWEHYQGDLGRTVPVSGHYSDEQRETWNIFVAAYQAGVKSLRDGTTQDQVVNAWRRELVRHRATARTAMAQRAIDTWSKSDNTPYLGMPHTMNLDAGSVDGPLRAGMTVDFEPIVSIDGQGFFLEDMFLITKDGVELLTPRCPLHRGGDRSSHAVA
jgi:Xaa-Pro aminopeptidase